MATVADRLASIYQPFRITAVKPLKTYLADHRTTLFIFLCVVAVYGLSFYKRQASYNYWMEHPEEYVVEQVTAMSTMDAYWWLKAARDHGCRQDWERADRSSQGIP